MYRRRTAESGFTLLELLVAFALSALLIAILGGGIRFGTRVWEISRVRSEAVTETLAIRRFLRERLLAARAVKRGGEGAGQKAMAFHGTRSGLALVTEMPSYVARGGLYRVELRTEDVADGPALVMNWWPFGGEKGGPGSGRRRLLEGVKDIQISFFGDPENAGDGRWLEDWPEDNAAMPKLVSVKLAFRDEDPRDWPELVVAFPDAAVPARGRRN